jgi:hypothetical protein
MIFKKVQKIESLFLLFSLEEFCLCSIFKQFLILKKSKAHKEFCSFSYVLLVDTKWLNAIDYNPKYAVKNIYNLGQKIDKKSQQL